MPENFFKFIYDEYGNTRKISVTGRGCGVLSHKYTNKGTSFTSKERASLKLEGLLPPAIRSLKSQVENCRNVFKQKDTDIEKYVYLRSLYERNVTLAHAVFASDIALFMPIIYTPTVGYACQHYSEMYRSPDGLFFYPGNIEQAEDILAMHGHRDIRIAVVTDNQGILGIGDQGAGGIAICLGKLMLYTQGAGIAPWHCLPISLDVGTDNQALLSDPNYLGWAHPRLSGEEYIRFIQRFARAFRTVFPNALCQWEDFSKQNAFAIRDAYLHDLISFNDDIQGTGAVALAAILTALRIKKEKLTEQVFLIHGAGAGGVGIAEQINFSLIEEGLSEKEAAGRIFTLDSRGLVTTNRKIEPYKVPFAKDPSNYPWLSVHKDAELPGVIKNAKVTILIGSSGQAGCFDKSIIEAMLANTPRPVVLPLSNPTSSCEARPQDICDWSGGNVLLSTGSPFGTVDMDGCSIRVGQCNNVFAFPGVGLGMLVSGAREVKPSFFAAAARVISKMVPSADEKKGILMPRLNELRKVSREVAIKVAMTAAQEGVSGLCVYSSFQHDNDPEKIRLLIDKIRWKPKYLPLVPA
ncbi:MAG TPA: NAD-dependent malic enzyme [bacterium]|nr:NAD-dependent malic enzyme [bacterium]